MSSEASAGKTVEKPLAFVNDLRPEDNVLIGTCATREPPRGLSIFHRDSTGNAL